MAAVLLRGELGPACYGEAALADPAIRAVEAITVLEEGAAAGRFATVAVTLEDGTVLEETVTAVVGDPDRPMAAEEVEAKFRRFTAAFGAAWATAVVRLLRHGGAEARAAGLLGFD